MFETKLNYCRVAWQGLPRYTALVRLAFKCRATAVLKSNLIRSIEFGTAVAQCLKRGQDNRQMRLILQKNEATFNRGLNKLTLLNPYSL